MKQSVKSAFKAAKNSAIAGLVCVFGACTNYFESGYHPQMLEEKKIQATRKFQTLRDEKIDLVVFATHLNEIERTYYKNLEYFFVELYAPSQEPINLYRVQIELSNANGVWEEPRYIRKITPDEYDAVLKPINKWSSCYLVAFEKLSMEKSDNAKLRISIDGEPQVLDFSYFVIPFQAI